MFRSLSNRITAFVPDAMYDGDWPSTRSFADGYVDYYRPIRDVKDPVDHVNWHGRWLGYIAPGDTSPLLDSPLHLIRQSDINNRGIPINQMRRRFYEAYDMMVNLTRIYKRGNLLPALIRAFALAIKERNTPALWRMAHKLTGIKPILNTLLDLNAHWRYPKSSFNPYVRQRQLNRMETNRLRALAKLRITNKRNAALKLRAAKQRAAANRIRALALLRRIVIN